MYYLCIFPLMSVAQCVQLRDPMDCSLLGSSVHGTLQVRTLEWVAIPFSRGSSRPRDWTHISWVSCISGRFFTISATREASHPHLPSPPPLTGTFFKMHDNDTLHKVTVPVSWPKIFLKGGCKSYSENGFEAEGRLFRRKTAIAPYKYLLIKKWSLTLHLQC